MHQAPCAAPEGRISPQPASNIAVLVCPRTPHDTAEHVARLQLGKPSGMRRLGSAPESPLATDACVPEPTVKDWGYTCPFHKLPAARQVTEKEPR